MMRNFFTTLLALVALTGLFTLVYPAAVTYAADPFNDVCTSAGGSSGSSTVCSSKSKATTNPLVGSNGILTRVTDILATIGGVMVVIMMIIAGIKYITSNGDSSQISSAKNTIIYGLVGLVVIILARTIISVVLTNV
jgi:hypothetical protein